MSTLTRSIAALLGNCWRGHVTSCVPFPCSTLIALPAIVLNISSALPPIKPLPDSLQGLCYAKMNCSRGAIVRLQDVMLQSAGVHHLPSYFTCGRLSPLALLDIILGSQFGPEGPQCFCGH